MHSKSDPLTSKAEYTVQHRLSVRLHWACVVLFFSLLACSGLALYFKGLPLLQTETNRTQEKTGENLVLTLAQQLSKVEALTTSMANVSVASDKDARLINNLIPIMLSQFTGDTEIAGGGIWPEEYQFDPNRQRYSFFWGKDQHGRLKFYDEYNDPEGPGYHHEEWYVPVRLLPDDRVYWSRSYTDPYSLEPMVTCSAPLRKEGVFLGVATVDLKLSGISHAMETILNRNQSYAFVVDRNHKFIAFPEPQQVRTVRKQNGNEYPDYLTVAEYAQKEPKFAAVAEMLDQLDYNEYFSAQELQLGYAQYVKDLEFSSYQINSADATRIASYIWEMQYASKNYPRVLLTKNLEEDFFLSDPVRVVVYSMPQTDWKVVTVFKQSDSMESAHEVAKKIFALFSVVVFLLMLLVYLWLKAGLLTRLSRLSRYLQKPHAAEKPMILFQDDLVQDELGVLINLYNEQSRQLLTARISAESANETKSEFLAKMSHELRTPLNSIIGFSNRLIKRAQQQNDEANLDSYYAIYRNAVQQLDLVNDILEHSAIESGLVKLKLAHFDINAMLQEVSQEVESIVKSKRLKFIMQMLPNEEKIFADRQKIKQVVAHLISNAVTVTKEGSITLSAEMAQSNNRPALTISVMDTGPGIDADKKAEMFKAFSQSNKQITQPSTGLGLYLSSYFVNMHDGDIQVHSTLHEGSCFVVTLPLAGPRQ